MLDSSQSEGKARACTQPTLNQSRTNAPPAACIVIMNGAKRDMDAGESIFCHLTMPPFCQVNGRKATYIQEIPVSSHASPDFRDGHSCIQDVMGEMSIPRRILTALWESW
ncbi:hypothetical protein VFPPC_17955 [Pochonia chlamydosporia 170]|uniref:Uncharacterized protein n=1 Tax=Pochonia chlamydosporia 170 TaxID=1380566 RepID=A0A219AQI0_METCM|nr:hypothetical protein VFPPC_17955 [Pochonia chlamydosporia 170]OWT42852.1 hypothetical protein VFPPC_17955 [Pochonia chlamydosporia 170]